MKWAATRVDSASRPEQFHKFNARRKQRHPRTMLASSTHDTKRSEDVRARLSSLSEIPERMGSSIEANGLR